MKTIKWIPVSIFLLISGISQAQVSVNVNIGAPPMWAPVGYEEAEYYYIPDVESYYDVRQSQFIYYGGGRWIRARHLPPPYRHYDLYNGYTVVLTDYHGHEPYAYFDNHKVKYFKGYRGNPQRTKGPKPPKFKGEHHGYQHGHGNKHGHGRH